MAKVGTGAGIHSRVAGLIAAFLNLAVAAVRRARAIRRAAVVRTVVVHAAAVAALVLLDDGIAAETRCHATGRTTR